MQGDKIIMDALALAREVQAQTDARRKFSGKPYITHPLRVMARVAAMPDVTPLEIAGAILHDVHEDPPFVSLDRIERQIHPQVAKYVGDLTNPSKKLAGADGRFPREWPRARRKAMDAEHLGNCDFWTQTIKAADRCDNIDELTIDLQGIGTKPPIDFIYLYCDESDILADVLDKIDPKQREELKRLVSLLRSIANHSK